MSKIKTIAITILVTFFISTPLAFAEPYKALQKKWSDTQHVASLSYDNSKVDQVSTMNKTTDVKPMTAVVKSQPLAEHRYKDPASVDEIEGTVWEEMDDVRNTSPTPPDEIEDLVWEEMDGWHSSTGIVIGSDGEPMELLIEIDPEGNGEIYLESDSEQVYQALLNQGRMEIVSEENGGTVTELWLRPGGDLLDFLDRKSQNADFGKTPRLIQGISHHEKARRAVNEVARHAGDDFERLALRLEVAEIMYAIWKEASTRDREMVKHATMPVPVEPNAPPVDSCTYHDKKNTSVISKSLDLTKYAKLHIGGGEARVSAFCEGRDGCIKADSKINFGKLRLGNDDGSNGCPRDDTEWGAEEFKVATVDFDGFGIAQRGCAKDYDDRDYARSIIAEIKVEGVVEANLKATPAEGDGVAARTTIQGTAVVCYEDDPVYDDMQDFLLSGEARSTLE